MHSSSILAFLATVLALAIAVVSAQSSNPLPCYQEKCSGLVKMVLDCGINVYDNGTLILSMDDQETSKCVCKQSVIDAYDPCYLCGAEHLRIDKEHSTQNLVDSCNVNMKTNLKMPGKDSSASSAKAHSVAIMALLVAVVSAFTMA
ncbi:hypothetical protein BGW41_000200 [Actinomortierella wolfii]|nr:hypothetical protein BGW41_000200 [Actinomortierella wolfii]